ncbi:MAG: threo-3-hydroxy-L-aspartate ammonia-lyase [Phycisphaerales bacterium]|nr:threo-3-hydroxy-L-aspartate ammonia-lyase [Phycisphaerales bacterium]
MNQMHDPDAPPSPVALADVQAAAERINGVANHTPTLTSRTVDDMTGARVCFKCENLQRVGAFKFRGAYNALAQLSDEQKRAGVLTYSSGNHAQAIALAGRLLHVPTTIIMPRDAPRVKLEATNGYLGPASEVILYDRTEETREALGARIAHERGLTIVPPYDHPHIIAGQGTVALELFEDVGHLDRLFVCVGGGGLLSGCAIAARGVCQPCKVIGVEPANADDAARSFRTRTLHTVHNPDTIADGARTPSLGRWTFPLVLANVDDVMTVTEDEIVRAMRLIWERLRLVVEPTGALALAGLLQVAKCAQDTVKAQHIGVIISGGNADIQRCVQRMCEMDAR